MTDAVYVDFDEPNPPRHASDGGSPGAIRKKRKKPSVARLPEPDRLPLGDELRRGVTDTERAAAKLHVMGLSYLEIAEKLELKDAREARRYVETALSASLTDDEIRMQRMVVQSRAELLWQQSAAMATADFLVTSSGKEVANERRLQWHQQAASDLMNIATLTGAKAPTKVEFTPGEAEMERLVAQLVARSGHEDIVDAEVIELDTIPAIERSPEEDEGGLS